MGRDVVVLIGDIVRSRRMKDRAAVQRKLKKVLEEVNESRGDLIEAEFMLTSGDSFEGVVRGIGAGYNIFKEIERKLCPIGIRGGIGVGEIETDWSKSVVEMDGPTFHSARRGLSQGKSVKSDLQVITGDKRFDDTINSTLALLRAVESKWTERQREIIEYAISHGNLGQAEIAEHFGVTQPAIAKTLSAARWRAVKRSRKFLKDRLREWDEVRR
ncbi:MAG: SatD family protein [Candidatus Hadarchaeota archaeon]|nr:SatD family protein [Candidatus Hadarchaeota archaeon]